MTSTDAADLTLRLVTHEDVRTVAELFLEARRAAEPAMPPHIHTEREVVAFHAERVQAGEELWLAEEAGLAVGYLHVVEDWLDALYVRPGHIGRGIGTEMLTLVKSLRPDGFALWVFESNEPARRFYRRHGLVELEHTDGSANEERSPDLRMAWPGADPMAYLRRRIDEVDDELALLLSRRAALTGAVQRFKSVPGHAGRDPDREAAIVTRMAARAPGVAPQALGRIMHEVISTSLDAAEATRSRS